MNALPPASDAPDARWRRPGAPSLARLGRFWMPALASMALGACGGGGGGGGDAPAGGPTASMPTLRGVATYDHVPNDNTGALVYASTTQRPIRGASVDVVDGVGTVVASTRTDASGAYSVQVPAGSSVSVRIKAQLVQAAGSATWDVSVRDNTQGNALYTLETPAVQVGTDTVVRNVTAPSGWTGSSYGATRAAGPFAILDTVYTTQAKVLSVAPSTAFPPLRVYWSVKNVGANGDIAQGDIGSTAFVTNAAGSAIYLVGRENVDTDEYDASVIAHEWGHYYQTSFSRDDSPGGSHSTRDLLDRRLAFSEGWGNAWSGIALDRADYTDSYDPGQSKGGRIALSDPAPSNPGWFREDSIQSIIWNLNRQVGFKPIHDAFTSGAFRRGAAVTSIHSFAAAVGAAAPSGAPVLAGLLGGQAISASTSDAFGAGETNSGGVASALPLYLGATVGVNTQVCVGYQAGTVNRLGNYAYLRFTAPTARRYVIGVNGGAGSDPDLAVWGAGVGLVSTARAAGVADSVSTNLPAGDVVVSVRDFNNSTTSPCFNVSIQ